MTINKKQLEEIINETIAVIYQLNDNKRIAIKCDNHKNYEISRNNKYLIISSTSFYTIENMILQQVHPFE